jgi:Cof subfamily protein (haloacid dehalogenase superfamily)
VDGDLSAVDDGAAAGRLPRVIATDLDGTLLRADGTLSPRTRDAVHAALRLGVEVVVLTARPPRYLTELIDELTLDGVAVCANGAILYDVAGRRTVRAHTLAGPTARQVARVLATSVPGLGFAVETGEYVVHEPGFTRPNRGDARVGVADLDALWARGDPIVKLLIHSGERSSEELHALALAALAGLVECTHSGGVGMLEVGPAGVTKAAALRELCRSRGVTPDEVVAFGDMPNDLEMLTWAGAGYAVANAHPSVLARVRLRTASNEEDGVAEALERLLGG